MRGLHKKHDNKGGFVERKYKNDLKDMTIPIIFGFPRINTRHL